MKLKHSITAITFGLLAACINETSTDRQHAHQKSGQQSTEQEVPHNAADSYQPSQGRNDLLEEARREVWEYEEVIVEELIYPAHSQANTEQYLDIDENRMKVVHEQPVSTFSVDVDTASYANVRRMLTREGRLPPTDAVKLEEMVNYFSYDYAAPTDLDQPFSVHTELAPSPWSENKMLMKIALQGYESPAESRPAANLVFLVDVSGSMQSQEKLPLLKKSLRMLVNQMNANDRIALVTYAGNAGLVLDSTAGNQKREIVRAINNLTAGGSTHGSAGIHLAYEVASEHFINQGINRIIIASDGDMNVGVTHVDELKDLIKKKRKSGIALTTLGFGTGNYNDAIMEQLADVGNGNASYIDSLKEAQKVLVSEMQSTLLTIAKDVKIQVEFNPTLVDEYRLLGYENRLLNREGFRNDKVDAGEIGAGHRVIAFYELSLTDNLTGSDSSSIAPLRYQTGTAPSKTVGSSELETRLDSELAFVRLRYKHPEENTSQEIGQAIKRDQIVAKFEHASENFRFASAVAAFAQQLRDSDYVHDLSYNQIIEIAKDAREEDPHGYRSEFLSLVELAQSLSQYSLSENS